MRSSLSAAMIVGLLLWPSAVLAAGEANGMSEDLERAQRRAEELWREGQEKILEGIETIIKAFPRYEAPEVTEDGDVIIRRKPEEKEGPAEEPPAQQEAEPVPDPKSI